MPGGPWGLATVLFCFPFLVLLFWLSPETTSRRELKTSLLMEHNDGNSRNVVPLYPQLFHRKLFIYRTHVFCVKKPKRNKENTLNTLAFP